jgi:hypothetical protein
MQIATAECPRLTGAGYLQLIAIERKDKDFWCLFGVCYRCAPVRGEGIAETKEKRCKPIALSDLATKSLVFRSL